MNVLERKKLKFRNSVIPEFLVRYRRTYVLKNIALMNYLLHNLFIFFNNWSCLFCKKVYPLGDRINTKIKSVKKRLPPQKWP